MAWTWWSMAFLRPGAARAPTLRSAQIILGVMRRDLIARCQPHAGMARNIFECALEIFLTMRLIADKRMEAEGHHPAGLLAVLVDLVELIDDHLAEILSRQALADAHRDVIDLERIGHGHHSGYV